jgi:hypothetical protein
MNDTVSEDVKLDDDKLREILAGCEGVTPGPWERRADHSHYDSVTDIYAQGFLIAQTCGKSFDGMEARAAHIARLDPATVASIITELLELRAYLAATKPPLPGDYDRGRRDMLNAILDLNPSAALARHIINGGTEDTFTNHEGKLPFDVVFWTCHVADQLGIKSIEEMMEDTHAK